MQINVADFTKLEIYRHLTHLVAPRPVALVSTISKLGEVNLSPFSFFNLFSSDPPIVIFSPLLRRDGSRKHTLHNVMEVPEVVINIVTTDIAAQASLASGDYADGVDEFLKAGFTRERAVKVKVPMVKEAKAKLECKVIEVKPLGTSGGAGNLVICEVLYIHIDDGVLTNGAVDHIKFPHAARLGGECYAEVHRETIFKLPRPNKIGTDDLPAFIMNSKLSGSDKARLATIEKIPEYDASFSDARISLIHTHCMQNKGLMEKVICTYASELLGHNQIQKAWQVLYRLQEIPGYA